MHMDEQRENAIISLLQKRDESALREIETHYGKLCFRLAKDILKSNEDTEECVSDTLLKVWETIPPQHPNSLRAYLVTITRRIAISKYRAQTAQKRGGTQFAEALDELQETLASDENVSAVVEQRELTQALEHFLDTLPPRNQKVFMQRYYLAESIQTIAEKNNMSQSAVKLSLFRTRQKLNAHLRKEGFL
ncbi:MAG TPA: RNA polymerase subunit sigma-70 [Ruminococcus sp.]|nr:RNA polymerase subunit sigma-70 [Ruminococcus sp.]